MQIQLPVPYFATREESDHQFARAFTMIARQRETEGRTADAARLRRMVASVVGPERACQVERSLEHERTPA